MSLINWGYFFMGVGVLASAIITLAIFAFLFWFVSQNMMGILFSFSVVMIIFFFGLWFGVRMTTPEEQQIAQVIPDRAEASFGWEEYRLISAMEEIKAYAIEERWLVFPEDSDSTFPAEGEQILLSTR
ncbi:MAG: hypothetical protein AAF633_01290 [Chloroflexota bacterium]